jgi:hypothetical protein
MKNHAVTAVVGIFTLAIGLLLGYYLDLIKDEKKNKIQYLDIHTEARKDLLRKLATKNNGDVNLTWNGNAIDSVSKIFVVIHNYSDKDFEHVPVFIELLSKSGKKIEVIDVQGVGDYGIEGHGIIDGYPQNKSESNILYGIDIGIINRSVGYSASYTISFLIKGSEIPTISANVMKKGIKSQDLTRFQLVEESIAEKHYPYVIIIVIAILLISFCMYGVIYTKKKHLSDIANLFLICQTTSLIPI